MRGTLARPRRPDGPLAVAAVIVGCGVLLLGLVVVSQGVPYIAIGAAGLLTVILALGFERAGILLMILALFFSPMNILRVVAGTASVTASDGLFVAATGLLLPTLLGKRLRVPALYAAGAIGLLSMGIIASLGTESTLLSLLFMSKLIIAGIVMPVVFMWWGPELRLILVMAVAYVAGNVVSVGYSFIDPVQQFRSYGLTTHVNNLGHASLLSLALMPFIFRLQPRWWRPFMCVAAVACGWGIWSSGSRAALLVLAVIIVVYPILEGSGRTVWFGAFGATLLLLFLSRIRSADQASALGRLFGGDASVNSDDQREGQLKLGWAQFKEHPIIGRGFVDVISFHNIYLAVAVAVGVLGLAAMLVMLWPAIQPVLFGRRPYGLISYVPLAYAGFGVLSTNLWDRFVWILISLALAARQLDERSREDEDDPDVQTAQPPLILATRPSTYSEI